MELPPFPPRTTEWLAGLHWANPSTPLDAYCYVRDTLAKGPAGHNRAQGFQSRLAAA